MSNILVTGGSGYVATFCILQLLEAGHQVRTTVRNLSREADVRKTVNCSDDRLSFFTADLTRDNGWSQAVEGCQYVLHVASPFPATSPKHEDDLIIPAREGTLRVMRASKAAGVRRVVLTSSFAAVGYGHPAQSQPFDETSWTDPNGEGVSAYVKSKTLAERAAWDFVRKEGEGLELSVVNPVGVFGPVLGSDYASSILLVRKLMDGSVPGCPCLYFGAVDVRDVADLHIRAMTSEAARNERFIAVAGDFVKIIEIAQTLKAHLGEAAKKVPARELPNWLIRLVALFDAEVRQILPELGTKKNATSEKAKRTLGWNPRSSTEALIATGESLVKLGLV